MKISMRKFMAVTEVKAKALLDKNVIIVPILIIGMTFMMKFIYSAIMKGEELPDIMLKMILSLGLTMNISMTGMFVTSAALAEEKEKHTLRTLMTSSVSSVEFFLGSLIPPFIEMMIVNLLLLPISGVAMGNVNIVIYILVCAISSLTSCIIGMILGIFAKNQMSASTLTTPFMLFFMMVPTFASMIPSMSRISSFLFTGVVTEMVTAFASGERFSLSAFNLIVLIGEIIIAFILFLYCYRKNGYEVD